MILPAALLRGLIISGCPTATSSGFIDQAVLNCLRGDEAALLPDKARPDMVVLHGSGV